MPDEPDFFSLRAEIFSISKEIVSLGACFQELNARLEESMKAQEQKQADHEVRVRKLELTCLHADWWDRNWARHEKTESRVGTLENKSYPCKLEQPFSNLLEKVEALRLFENRVLGSKQWEDRIWMGVQAVITAAAVALVIWFMKGGAIS